MKYLKVLVLGLLLTVSSIASADEPPTEYQCNVVSSMASTVQRMRVEYSITKNDMKVRALRHTPIPLIKPMLEVIDIVYDGVSPEIKPEDLYVMIMDSCTGVEV